MKSANAVLSLLALAFLLVTATHSYAANDAKDGMRTIKLEVKGMCCPSCLNDIENSLTAVSGVKSAKASFDPPETTVTFDAKKATINDLIIAVGKIGYEAKEKSAATPKRS